MTDPPRILIADDEETFLRSTADLLRKEGYRCDCAGDADTVSKMLESMHYDVLIADIKMPGNSNLELVDRLADVNSGLPIILVTGYPSTDSALKSVETPVWSYLVKPVEFSELLEKVKAAIRHRITLRALNDTQTHLRTWESKLKQAEQVLREVPKGTVDVSVQTFLSVTMNYIVLALSDIQRLSASLATASGASDACHLMQCPRLDTFRSAVRKTVAGLEKTKGAFKSKEIKELREDLEQLLADDTLLNMDPGMPTSDRGGD